MEPLILRLKTLFLLYLLLFLASTAVRWDAPAKVVLRPGQSSFFTPEVAHGVSTARLIEFAYTDQGPVEGAPVVVLIHGSPVASSAMVTLADRLSASVRVISPDLPGLGRSTAEITDYSIRSHGVYLQRLLDHLRVSEAHLVGYSMGGGVGLELAHLDPERVQSITLLASIGVQEFELLGDYHLNHAVHGLQLGALTLARNLIPHFGAWDGAVLGKGYARNFFDSDQRPLRSILEWFEAPMLIVHGDRDSLVPIAAAQEHHRLVPQSEWVEYAGGHITCLRAPDSVVVPILDFIARVEVGEAPRREEADLVRVNEAKRPFDRSQVPPVSGMSWIVMLLLLAAATLVSEDLACLGGGLLVANGTISYFSAVLGCSLGILVGDVGLFIVGRMVGRRVVSVAPFRWWVSEERLQRAGAWLDRQGAIVIFASRFTPGLRLPTYLAAGCLPTRFWWFLGYFLLAILLWTPAAVGIGAIVGRPVLDWALSMQGAAGWVLLAEIAILLVIWKCIVPLFTYRGRRGFVRRWLRFKRYEYWPTWVFYPPMVLYVVTQMIRFRSMTIFACANPGIEHGGFIGESKSKILTGLEPTGDAVARWKLIPAELSVDQRVSMVRSFQEVQRLAWPIVLKPDAGERGSGVAILHDAAQLRDYLERHPLPSIVQEFVPGLEFGVFYVRRPEEPRGKIFSITDKRFPELIGDGVRTLEQLILEDRVALPMSEKYLARFGDRAYEVPDDGERIPLIDVGTHALGSVFLDGDDLITPELEEEIDRVSQQFQGGFYFGRFDIRVSDLMAFQKGQGLRIIELNGVSSEATAIYDPRHRLVHAYRVLFRQWKLVFEIGAENHRRGLAEIPGQWTLWKRIFTSDPRPQGPLAPPVAGGGAGLNDVGPSGDRIASDRKEAREETIGSSNSLSPGSGTSSLSTNSHD